MWLFDDAALSEALETILSGEGLAVVVVVTLFLVALGVLPQFPQ